MSFLEKKFKKREEHQQLKINLDEADNKEKAMKKEIKVFSLKFFINFQFF